MPEADKTTTSAPSDPGAGTRFTVMSVVCIVAALGILTAVLRDRKPAPATDATQTAMEVTEAATQPAEPSVPAPRLAGPGFDEPTLALGPPSAPTQITFVADPCCQYCRGQLRGTIVKLLDEAPGAYRVELRLFPFMSPNSELGGRAWYAAHRQGRLREFLTALPPRQCPAGEGLQRVAQQAGLDVARFWRDVQSPDLSALVEAEKEASRTAHIEATPTLIVAGQLLDSKTSFTPEGIKGQLKQIAATPRPATLEDPIRALRTAYTATRVLSAGGPPATRFPGRDSLPLPRKHQVLPWVHGATGYSVSVLVLYDAASLRGPGFRRFHGLIEVLSQDFPHAKLVVWEAADDDGTDSLEQALRTARFQGWFWSAAELLATGSPPPAEAVYDFVESRPLHNAANGYTRPAYSRRIQVAATLAESVGPDFAFYEKLLRAQ
ncbi:MAG: protein-disulfide isomerase [Myxococcota bacterium]|jgi:protein-disulfide isomerase